MPERHGKTYQIGEEFGPLAG